MDDEPICPRCGSNEDVRTLPFVINGQNPVICRTCETKVYNETPHTCRGCGRTFTRLDGMHATVLEVDGTLKFNDRHYRNRDTGAEWDEPEFISRVICVNCCPAAEHGEEHGWCSIMEPVMADE